MASKISMRLLCQGANLGIVLTLVHKIPDFLSNMILLVVLLLDLLVILSIDMTLLLLTVIIEQPVILGILSLIQNLDATSASILTLGLVIHVLIINNQLLANLM